jgi:tetratricopeptide (TPR) repeat protein
MSRKDQLLEFLKTSPKDDFLNYALAQEYISEGNDVAAQDLFNSLLEWHPNYVATYYHLGKLLERQGLKEQAMEMYRKGMEKAREAREQHSLAELQSALLELEYDT